jgi:hypothetical protein
MRVKHYRGALVYDPYHVRIIARVRDREERAAYRRRISGALRVLAAIDTMQVNMPELPVLRDEVTSYAVTVGQTFYSGPLPPLREQPWYRRLLELWT